MTVALVAAFAVGRIVWPAHWTWTVLTAFIVCSGARSRGDVVLKGVLRGTGAAVGTVVATAIAGTFGPHEASSVVVMFAVLGVATWLREFSYAWWAACVTAVLSLLYGWFGQSPGLLDTRLAGIAVGAALGIAASWLILPLRTRDVARRRTADALAVLGGLLAADWDDPAALRRHQVAFHHAVTRLGQVAPPLRAQRMLLSSRRVLPSRVSSPLRAPLQALPRLRTFPLRTLLPLRTPRMVRASRTGRPKLARMADAIDALVHSELSVRALASAAADGSAAADPCVRQLNRAVAANVAAARRAIGQRPGAAYQAAVRQWPSPEARHSSAPPQERTEVAAGEGSVLHALFGIDTALAAVWTAFGVQEAGAK